MALATFKAAPLWFLVGWGQEKWNTLCAPHGGCQTPLFDFTAIDRKAPGVRRTGWLAPGVNWEPGDGLGNLVIRPGHGNPGVRRRTQSTALGGAAHLTTPSASRWEISISERPIPANTSRVCSPNAGGCMRRVKS